MRNLFTFSLLILLLSCQEDSDQLYLEDSQSPNGSVLTEHSFIVDGELVTFQIDPQGNVPENLQTEEYFRLKEAFLNKSLVYYVNPFFDQPLIFSNGERYRAFISDELERSDMQKKFGSQKFVENSSKFASEASRLSKYFSIHKSHSFGGASFTKYTTIGYDNPRLQSNTHLTNNINFNDDISSIKVSNVYAAFYEGSYYQHETIVIDARGGFVQIANLQDLRMDDVFINNTGTISDTNDICGFLCFDSFNDEITSISVNASGGTKVGPYFVSGGGGSGSGIINEK